MEDAHTTELEVDGHKDVSFFAVFDGHGGTEPAGPLPAEPRSLMPPPGWTGGATDHRGTTVGDPAGQTIAQYAGRNAHHRVLSDIEFTRGNYAQALRNAFLGIDEDLRRRTPPRAGKPSANPVHGFF